MGRVFDGERVSVRELRKWYGCGFFVHLRPALFIELNIQEKLYVKNAGWQPFDSTQGSPALRD
jgi:hypothetical protein